MNNPLINHVKNTNYQISTKQTMNHVLFENMSERILPNFFTRHFFSLPHCPVDNGSLGGALPISKIYFFHFFLNNFFLGFGPLQRRVVYSWVLSDLLIGPSVLDTVDQVL